MLGIVQCTRLAAVFENIVVPERTYSLKRETNIKQSHTHNSLITIFKGYKSVPCVAGFFHNPKITIQTKVRKYPERFLWPSVYHKG